MLVAYPLLVNQFVNWKITSDIYIYIYHTYGNTQTYSNINKQDLIFKRNNYFKRRYVLLKMHEQIR